MNALEERKTFDLMRSRTIYDDKVKLSYYYVPSERAERMYKPILLPDEFGDLQKRQLNVVTGEIKDYTRSQCLKSFASVKSNAWRFISMLLDANHFDWFVTLTFDNAVINRYNDEEVYNAYTKWIRLVKKECPNVRYLTVVERHHELDKEEQAIHFHILMGDITAKQLHLKYSGKVCCSWLSEGYTACNEDYFNRTKEGRVLTDTDGIKIYNIGNFFYGLTTVTEVQAQSACKTYVKKYLKKDIGATKVFKKNYFYSRNLNRPIIEKDKLNTLDHIKSISSEFYEDDYTINAVNDYYSPKHSVRQVELGRISYDLINEGVDILQIIDKQAYERKHALDDLEELDIDVIDIF